MTTRNEYVESMKTHLDQWNKEIAQWEAKAKVAKVDMRIDYEMHLETLRKQRDLALEKLDALQKSSGDAWQELTQGAEEAWAKMREAIEKASTHFSK
jgi:predicted  nucleic acid-binding Zn-ribbon protein